MKVRTIQPMQSPEFFLMGEEYVEYVIKLVKEYEELNAIEESDWLEIR